MSPQIYRNIVPGVIVKQMRCRWEYRGNVTPSAETIINLMYREDTSTQRRWEGRGRGKTFEEE